MKPRRFTPIVALLCCVTALPPVRGQEIPTAAPESVGLSSEKLAEVTSAMQAMVERKEIAGAMTVIARHGKIAYFEACGMMDAEKAKPMAPDTILRIYSMSKPITSTALMMLCEEGRCSLDDPVSKYIPELKDLKVLVKDAPDEPEFEPLKRPITLEHLLLHTSGMAYGFFGSPVDRYYLKENVLDMDDSLAAMIAKLSKLPLQAQPGEVWSYSVSIDVAGRVVEIVSGMPLDRFLKERIFDPLDMPDTGFQVPADKLDRFAACYGPGDSGALKVLDKPAESRYARPAVLFSGGGGLVSTARDYLRFCQMILNQGELNGRRILKPETVEQMTRNHLSPDVFPIRWADQKSEGVGFGLGFCVRVNDAPGSADHLGEFGWDGAASTHFWISPKDDMIVITLSQYMPFSPRLKDTLKPLIYAALESPDVAKQQDGGHD